MTDQIAVDARIELGFALATYIHKYPASEWSLPVRIAVLTAKSFADPDMDALVQETEYWLEQFESYGEAMTSKGKVMGSLGSADGAVLRCLDILERAKDKYQPVNDFEFFEMTSKLQLAHEAILVAAKEIEGKEENL